MFSASNAMKYEEKIDRVLPFAYFDAVIRHPCLFFLLRAKSSFVCVCVSNTIFALMSSGNFCISASNYIDAANRVFGLLSIILYYIDTNYADERLIL